MNRYLSLGLIGLVLLTAVVPLHAQQIDPELLAGMKARAIGPAGMSGRVAAVAGLPSDPATVYVGAATGGVWKSTNGGLTWKALFDDQPVHAIGSIAVHPANHDIVWVGTGEGNVRNSVSVGNGIYKSLDAGRTWTHLGLEATERINRILPHPSDTNVAYVCAQGRLWGENPERGVFKTTDGGKTWDHILSADEKTGCSYMAMDPSNPDKLIVGMWQFRRWPYFFKSGGPGSALQITVDGGKTWKKYTEEDGLPKGELGRIGVAFSPSNPEIVYALVEAKKSALLRSDNGGESWSKVNTETNITGRPFYYSDLRVDPEFPNRVYLIQSTVRVSDDGGKTVRTLVPFFAAHPDHHTMWINPTDPRHILVGNDGGVSISRDRGRTWRFVRNLPLAQYYHVHVDMDKPYNIYGGLQDNGSWRGPSTLREGGFGGGIRNHHWTMVGFGDGFDTSPDPEDSMRGYGMSQGGNLYRWNLRNGEQLNLRPADPDDEQLRFNWNAGFAQDPFDPATIYYGSQYVHKSADRGESWTIISPDLTSNKPEWQTFNKSGGITLDVTTAENFTTIITIEPSAVQQGVIWAGTDDGRLHVTRDAGQNWQSVEKNVKGVPANTWIPHVTPSKFDAATAFVVFDNHRRSDINTYVFKTTNYGRSWTQLTTDGVRGYALKVEQDPVKQDLLFLGTEFGLWVSLDGGQNWFQWKHGVPTASAMDMVIHPREHDLVIGTHGRALFVLDDISPLRSLSADTLKEPVHLFNIPDGQQYRPVSAPGELFPGQGEFRGATRPYGAIFTVSFNFDDLPHPNEKIERERKEKKRQEARDKGEEKKEEPEESEQAQRGPGRRGGGGGPGEPGGRGPQGPQATIEITDADGKVIRTFKRAVKLGINRITWNLRRDGFKRPGRQQQSPSPFRQQGGPEVLPGTYGVRVKYKKETAEGTVTVLADPRYNISAADRQAKMHTLIKAGRLQEAVAEAVNRILDTRSDIDLVLKKATAQKKKEENQESGDEADKKDDPLQPLRKAARELKKALTDLEKRLWTPPNQKGISDRSANVMSRVRRASGSLSSSWGAPNPNQLANLRRAEKEVGEAIAEVNKLFEEKVAAFRQQVNELNIELFPAHEPISVKE